MASSLQDHYGRPLGVLRLSLTALCNLACPYCLPDAEEPPELLTLEERGPAGGDSGGAWGPHPAPHRWGAPAASGAGAPDHGPQAPATGRLMRQLDAEGALGGLRQIALTTNGVMLSAQRALALKEAGLDRITISLDGADGASVARMAGSQGGASSGAALLEKVLAAIEHARDGGLRSGFRGPQAECGDHPRRQPGSADSPG